MDVLFNSTKNFEEDLSKLDDTEKNVIINEINNYCKALPDDKSVFFKKANKLEIKLKADLDPSIYYLIIDEKIYILLAIDEDPIFNQIIVTLLKISIQNAYYKEFMSIAKSLYKEEGIAVLENENVKI